MSIPIRKNPRLKNYDYSSPGTYFITICTNNKEMYFGEIIANFDMSMAKNVLSKYGIIAKEQIELLETNFTGLIIDNYVIMPNHIHILISNYEMKPHDLERFPIYEIIRVLKSKITVYCRRSGFAEPHLFQKSYHDHIVRNKSEYEKIYKYIDENPLRWNRDIFFKL